MKYYLFFILVLLLGCNHHERHQSENREKKFTYTNFDKEEFSIKRTEGKIFDKNLWSRIEMKTYKSPYMFSKAAITVSHYADNMWKQSYTDTLSHIYIECDSIAMADINNDGSYELMLQIFEGMGNLTDYYCEVYAMKKEKIVKLDKLSSMMNVSFQTNESTFTTFEKGDELYIGRKYFLDKKLNFELIQEQHLFESKNKWLKKNYTVKNGQKILKNQKLDDSLAKEFYGFLNWCK